MEPDININHLEINARGDKQAKFNNLFDQLRSLPNGPEVAIEEKEDLYEQLLTMLTEGDFYSASDRESLIQRVTDAFKYSTMTEEEAKVAKARKQEELDARYRSPGFKE